MNILHAPAFLSFRVDIIVVICSTQRLRANPANNGDNTRGALTVITYGFTD